MLRKLKDEEKNSGYYYSVNIPVDWHHKECM